MDLIYTTAERVDVGVISAYAFDLSYGADENDFEITIGVDNNILEFDGFIYIEGTEYGGIVDLLKATTNGDAVTYCGRTWHGLLNSKVIQPDEGQNYYTITGDANSALAVLIDRLGLSGLFMADSKASGINISKYQFKRYCKGYDGIMDMLSSVNAKLKIEWLNRSVVLSAVPIVDYSESPIDCDTANLSVEKHQNKVNHLICLGKGELAEREVLHLYVDSFGKIGKTQYYSGVEEFADVYDNSNAEDLETESINKFKAQKSGYGVFGYVMHFLCGFSCK